MTRGICCHLSQFEKPVILSDGDVVFQPRKVQRSGIWDASNARYMAPDVTISWM